VLSARDITAQGCLYCGMPDSHRCSEQRQLTRLLNESWPEFCTGKLHVSIYTTEELQLKLAERVKLLVYPSKYYV